MKTDKVKPCPFCGAKGVPEMWMNRTHLKMQHAPDCYFGGAHLWMEHDDRIPCWNRRDKRTANKALNHSESKS